MSTALPGSLGLFSHIQNIMKLNTKGRSRLSNGVHTTLDNFCWIKCSLVERPTRLKELIFLPPTTTGHHDASGAGVGGFIFLSHSMINRHLFKRVHILLRMEWAEKIRW